MNKGWAKRAFGDPLGRRLVIYSLLISTVLSTVAAGIQLTFSYQRQRDDVSAIFDQIENALATPLEKALWKFDFGQVDVILDGIFANEAVATLTLDIPSGNKSWTRGEGAEFDLQKVYLLVHIKPDGEEVVVGELKAYLSLREVSSKIWAQFWTLVASNLIKAYISASLMLFLFYFLVTRHLKAITQFIDHAGSELGGSDLNLVRSRKEFQDDLDNIVAALNQYRTGFVAMISELQSEIRVREKAEAEAQSALEIRKLFLANMSHEIRTPLNAIGGLFQLIMMSDAPDRQKKQAEVGLNASHHLLAQLVNVLELSRMEANAIEIKAQNVELKPLMDEWLQTAIATCHRLGKTIKVSLECSENTPERWCFDARRVTQIVNNLTDNALKFTDEGAVAIHISVEHTAGQDASEQLSVAVCDTGCGIANDQFDAIFERFAQVDSSETRQHGGSGLGLSICRELAELMGATLDVKTLCSSCFVTTFTLKLLRNPHKVVS